MTGRSYKVSFEVLSRIFLTLMSNYLSCMSIHFFKRNLRHYLSAAALVVFAFAAGPSVIAQDFRTVHDGVEYALVDHMIGDDPVRINLLRIDLTKVRLDLKMAMDTVVGTETTSSIASRHGAVAAVNAGFFRLDASIFAGEPANFFMIDGKVLSEGSNDRITLAIANHIGVTRVSFFRPVAEFQLETGKETFTVNGLNREVRENEVIVFTPEFHKTTLAKAGCVEIAVSSGRVRTVSEAGSVRIPADGFVATTCGDQKNELQRAAKPGQKANVFRMEAARKRSDGYELGDIGRIEDAVAGVSQLLKNGRIELSWQQEKAGSSFAESRHPRTAAAKMSDGKFLLATIDGRQPGVSVGMTLQELAEYLLSIGAVDAMNLDGGGSTAMVLDGKVVNKPSDANGERKVGDALIVTLRNAEKR